MGIAAVEQPPSINSIIDEPLDKDISVSNIIEQSQQVSAQTFSVVVKESFL